MALARLTSLPPSIPIRPTPAFEVAFGQQLHLVASRLAGSAWWND
jgi:hypothetical protein